MDKHDLEYVESNIHRKFEWHWIAVADIRSRDAGAPTALCISTSNQQALIQSRHARGSLENAALMANRASTRTTQLYDRRSDNVTLDEVERIIF